MIAWVLIKLMDITSRTPFLWGRVYQWLGGLWSAEMDRVEFTRCSRRGHDAVQNLGLRYCVRCYCVLKQKANR